MGLSIESDVLDEESCSYGCKQIHEGRRDRIFGLTNEMTSFSGTRKIESILRHTQSLSIAHRSLACINFIFTNSHPII
jgi:hypothetical protein